MALLCEGLDRHLRIRGDYHPSLAHGPVCVSHLVGDTSHILQDECNFWHGQRLGDVGAQAERSELTLQLLGQTTASDMDKAVNGCSRLTSDVPAARQGNHGPGVDGGWFEHHVDKASTRELHRRPI